MRLLSDLDTLAFARQQIANLEDCLHQIAASEPRLPLLLQLPGFGILNAITVLAAIGDISRFPDARHLVGYAGLGGRLHDSGETTRTGKITKAGRRDLRAAMVEAAQVAANTHPHWQAELARLEPRKGRNKAIVAIARKLLVAIWHVLTKQIADKHAQPVLVARKRVSYSVVISGKTRIGISLQPAELLKVSLIVQNSAEELQRQVSLISARIAPSKEDKCPISLMGSFTSG